MTAKLESVFTLVVVAQVHDCPFHPVERDDLVGPLPGHGCKRRSLGSGFLFGAVGLALTNEHVVERAVLVEAVFPDGQRRPVDVLGTDPETDVALIRVGGAGRLPAPLPVRRPQFLRVGDPVYAVGSPLGLGGTLSRGIVSHTSRELESSPFVDFLQTTAGIHPGNSGGPLLDAGGQVVGINAAYLHSEGLGLAIRIDAALRIAARLREHGEVSRGSLGVWLQPLDDELAQMLGLPVRSGMLITDVASDGPGAAAGLQVGEVIISLNGRRLERLDRVDREVAGLPIGSMAIIRVQGVSESRETQVEVRVLEQRPSTPRRGLVTSPLGMSVGGPPADAAGVLVLEVEPGGAAERAGIAARDFVVEADRRAVGSLAGFRAAVERYLDKREPILLKLRRGDRHVFTVLRRTDVR